MIYLQALIIPLISYLLQIYPRLINRYYGVDVWMRLIEADFIRNNRHRIPLHPVKEKFIVGGIINYPLGLSWLMSFIPRKILTEVQGFIAPVFDILHNYLIFLITYQLTGRADFAFLAQIIYTLTPLTVLENSYLTPRSFGYLLFTMTFYPLLLYSVSPNPVYLAISFFSLFLSFFVHKFEVQSLLFISVFFSLVEMNFLYILLFLGTMLMALAFSKGYYLRIVREHISHIYFWAKNYNARFDHQTKSKSKKKKLDLVGNIYYLLKLLSPFALIASNFWITGPLFFLAAMFLNVNLLPIDNPLMLKLSLWGVFFYVLSILVLSIKYLVPIGEGQRYMEMALAPAAIISTIVFGSFFNTPYITYAIALFVLAVIFNLAVIIFMQWRLVIKDKNRTMTKDMRDTFAFINKLKFKPRVLSYPPQIASMALFNIKGETILDVNSKVSAQMRDVYPVLTRPIKEVIKKYRLNILLLRKSYLTATDLKLDRKNIIFETDETQVLKV